MPALRNWLARTIDGGEVSRETAPGRQVPADCRSVEVEAEAAPRVRAVVKPGEAIRVFTRRHESVTPLTGEAASSAIPCIEITASGPVRAFLLNGEILLTTEDDHAAR